MPTNVKFHSKYIYNNYMYMLAGYVAERLSGKSWKTLVREKIFAPLEMTSSTFIGDITDWDNTAFPHMSFNGSLEELDKDLLT